MIGHVLADLHRIRFLFGALLAAAHIITALLSLLLHNVSILVRIFLTEFSVRCVSIPQAQKLSIS